MNVKLPIGAAAAAILFASAVAQADDSRHYRPTRSAELGVPPVMVRVTAIRGTGPDGREHRLFSDSNGQLVPLMDLGRLSAGFSGVGVPPGAYYDLQADLVNELQVFNPNGTRVKTQFFPDGTPPELAVAGAVVVADDQAQVLGLMPQFAVDSWRSEGVGRGHRFDDDDREDDDD